MDSLYWPCFNKRLFVSIPTKIILRNVSLVFELMEMPTSGLYLKKQTFIISGLHITLMHQDRIKVVSCLCKFNYLNISFSYKYFVNIVKHYNVLS
jgi:hypothetical protein